MTHPPRRQKNGYFAVEENVPLPLVMRVQHRVRFSDVDPMAILWHGRYAELFEEANEEIGRACGMGYGDYHREKLRAPVVQLHVDYFAPVRLGELVTIIGRMIWSEAARMNIEYEIRRESGELAATGYTVQMLVDLAGTPMLACPELLETCRRRWRAGEFGGLR